MLALRGSDRPLTNPATPSNFSCHDLGNRMTCGMIDGAARGFQQGGPAGVPPGAIGGGLAAGMGYCATHGPGVGPTYSSNIDSCMRIPANRQPLYM